MNVVELSRLTVARIDEISEENTATYPEQRERVGR